MTHNTSFFIQSVGWIHKSGILNPTHATELTVLEDQGGLIETLHHYGNTLRLSDIQQRTDRLHQVHCAVAYIARAALNLASAMTVAPCGTLYHCYRCLQTQEERAASLQGLKYDCLITATALFSLGMGFVGIKYFRRLLLIDLRLVLIVAILSAATASVIATFRPYYGQHSSALAAYLLAKNFGVVQKNGYPLSYNPGQDNEKWEFNAKGVPQPPEYDTSVMYRQWIDAIDQVIISFRDVMESELDVNMVVTLLEKANFQALRQMAVAIGKDVTRFDEALRHYDITWKMNVEMGKQCLTNGDPTSMNETKRGWGYKKVEIFFDSMRTGLFKHYDKQKIRDLLKPPQNPLESYKTFLEGLDLEQVPNQQAKKFLLYLREIVNKNRDLETLRAQLKLAVCSAADEDTIDYNRLKKQANAWFHPDKNSGWNVATEAFRTYQAIIKLIDTGTI